MVACIDTRSLHFAWLQKLIWYHFKGQGISSTTHFQHHGITIFVHELVKQHARNVSDEYYFDSPHDNAKWAMNLYNWIVHGYYAWNESLRELGNAQYF